MVNMKNISLTKVTFIVAMTTLASSLVSAKDVLPQNIPAIASTASVNTQFEQLDSDKDNLLSLDEAKASKIIHDAFTKIDTNSDTTITKDEFTNYITK